MDEALEKFHELMSNRTVSIVVMIFASIGTIVSIAGGFYGTYLLMTLIGAS